MWISVKSKVHNTYLFLDNVSMRDSHHMRQVAAERPYKMGYDLKEKKWGIIASSLSGTRINIDENLFGEEGVSAKGVKTRLFALMTWCKTQQEIKPFGSEMDGEEAPTGLLDMIEEDYSQYEEVVK